MMKFFFGKGGTVTLFQNPTPSRGDTFDRFPITFKLQTLKILIKAQPLFTNNITKFELYEIARIDKTLRPRSEHFETNKTFNFYWPPVYNVVFEPQLTVCCREREQYGG